MINLINWQILQPLIDKASKQLQIQINIRDMKGIQVIDSMPANTGSEEENTSPVRAVKKAEKTRLINLNSKAVGKFYCYGQIEDKYIDVLHIAIESMLATNEQKDQQHYIANEERDLLNDLLSPNAVNQKSRLKTKGLKLGYDLTLPRSIIVFMLEPKENQYFNINLHLGYDVTRERLKNNIIQVIKDNIFITSQDLIAYYKQNALVICKAFVEINNLPRLYEALDIMSRKLYDNITGRHLFLYSVAYGSIVSDLVDLQQSYQEAVEIINLGKSRGVEVGYIDATTFLFELIVQGLPRQLISNKLELWLQNILSYGEEGRELLETAEVFIDNKMNIKQTAEQLFMHRNTVTNRLKKLKEMTGLDPYTGFQDCFWVKALAVYRRLAVYKSQIPN